MRKLKIMITHKQHQIFFVYPTCNENEMCERLM